MATDREAREEGRERAKGFRQSKLLADPKFLSRPAAPQVFPHSAGKGWARISNHHNRRAAAR
jgi:hypothetical protein